MAERLTCYAIMLLLCMKYWLSVKERGCDLQLIFSYSPHSMWVVKSLVW